MLGTKSRIAFFAASFIVTFLLMAFVLRFGNHSHEVFAKRIFLKEGFDFRQLRSLNPDLSVPKIGAKIDLSELQTSKRENLSSLIDKDLLLLVVVEPSCAACKFSKDMMQSIHKTTDEHGIKYLPIVFTKTPPNVNTQQYAEALGFETCVQWSSEALAPEALRTMVTPSHILTSKDGVVLQIWPGTDKDAEARKRMSEQISSDLFLINDVVTAQGMSNPAMRPH